MFNKIININHIITKFATVVPYTCMIMCTKFGKKRTIFAEVTLKGEWTQIRGPEKHWQISSFACNMQCLTSLQNP